MPLPHRLQRQPHDREACWVLRYRAVSGHEGVHSWRGSGGRSWGTGTPGVTSLLQGPPTHQLCEQGWHLSLSVFGSALLCNITGSVGCYHSYRGVTTAQWLPVKQGWRNGRTVAGHREPPPHPHPSLCKTTIQCDNTCEPPRNQVDMTKGIRPTSVPTGQGGSQEEAGWHVKSSDCPHGVERLHSRQDQGGAAVVSGDPTPEFPRSEHVGRCSRGYEGLCWLGSSDGPQREDSKHWTRKDLNWTYNWHFKLDWQGEHQ